MIVALWGVDLGTKEERGAVIQLDVKYRRLPQQRRGWLRDEGVGGFF